MQHSEIIDSVDYDPETGEAFWKCSDFKSSIWNAKYPGKWIGSIFYAQHGKKYWRTKVSGKNILVHRLIWFIMTGAFIDLVDHKNGDGLDNRWINLRDATLSQNQANCDMLVRGIDPFPNGKWRAKITVDYQQVHLGMYDSKEEALEVYKSALIAVHGEFAVYNRRA